MKLTPEWARPATTAGPREGSGSLWGGQRIGTVLIRPGRALKDAEFDERPDADDQHQDVEDPAERRLVRRRNPAHVHRRHGEAEEAEDDTEHRRREEYVCVPGRPVA